MMRIERRWRGMEEKASNQNTRLESWCRHDGRNGLLLRCTVTTLWFCDMSWNKDGWPAEDFSTHIACLWFLLAMDDEMYFHALELPFPSWRWRITVALMSVCLSGRMFHQRLLGRHLSIVVNAALPGTRIQFWPWVTVCVEFVRFLPMSAWVLRFPLRVQRCVFYVDWSSASQELSVRWIVRVNLSLSVQRCAGWVDWPW